MSSISERNSRIMDRVSQGAGRIADRNFAKQEGTKDRIAQMVQDFMARKDADKQREFVTSERLGAEEFTAGQQTELLAAQKQAATTEMAFELTKLEKTHQDKLEQLDEASKDRLDEIVKEDKLRKDENDRLYAENGLIEEYNKREAKRKDETQRAYEKWHYDTIEAPDREDVQEHEIERAKILAADRGAGAPGDENDPTSQAYIEAIFKMQWAANRKGMLDENGYLLEVYTEEQLAPFRDYMMTVIEETSRDNPQAMLRAQQSLNAWIASMIGTPDPDTGGGIGDGYPLKRVRPIPHIDLTDKPRVGLSTAVHGGIAGERAAAQEAEREAVPGEYLDPYTGVSPNEFDLFERIKGLLAQASSTAASDTLQGHMDTIKSKNLTAYQLSQLTKKIDAYAAKTPGAEEVPAAAPETDTLDLKARGSDIKAKSNERIVTQLTGYLDGADASLKRRIENALAKLEGGDSSEANMLLNLLRKTR